MSTIYATISKGPDTGKRLYPHLHEDGFYVASPSRFEKDYIKVRTLDELEVLIRAGYGARLKAPDSKNAPSIIVAKNIHLDGKRGIHATPLALLPAVVSETDLDPESIVPRRREQAFLRAHLLGGKPTGECVICGETFPQGLLIAAHIKVRSECTRDEKLDFDCIAALMCKFGCDALYEGLYIFIEDGEIKANSKKARSATYHVKIVIKAIEGKRVSNWSKSRAYYEWHRKQCERA